MFVLFFLCKNTALHFAAREGHAKAVALLLSYDADVVLNKQEASFLHFAIRNRRKEVVLTTIRSKRYAGFLPVVTECPLACGVTHKPGGNRKGKTVSAVNHIVSMSVVYIKFLMNSLGDGRHAA